MDDVGTHCWHTTRHATRHATNAGHVDLVVLPAEGVGHAIAAGRARHQQGHDHGQRQVGRVQELHHVRRHVRFNLPPLPQSLSSAHGTADQHTSHTTGPRARRTRTRTRTRRASKTTTTTAASTTKTSRPTVSLRVLKFSVPLASDLHVPSRTARSKWNVRFAPKVLAGKNGGKRTA